MSCGYCKDCKYWVASKCVDIPTSSPKDSTAILYQASHCEKPMYPSVLFSVTNGGALLTDENFGCVQFEAK